jgi:hypothetical protein
MSCNERQGNSWTRNAVRKCLVITYIDNLNVRAYLHCTYVGMRCFSLPMYQCYLFRFNLAKNAALASCSKWSIDN